MKRPSLLITFLLLIVLLSSACRPQAKPGKGASEKESGQETIIRVAISRKALTLTSLLAIADKQGYFKQNGLRIEKVLNQGTTQPLTNKQADVAITSVVQALSNFLNNKNVKFLAALESFDSGFDASNRFLVSRFPKEEAVSASEIGIQKMARNERLLIRMLLKKIGVEKKQLNYIEVDEEAQRVVMLAKGELDIAFIGSAKRVDQLRSQSDFTFFDSHQLLKGYYIPNGIISTEYAIGQKGKAIKGFVKAMYKALQYVGKNKEKTISFFEKNGLSKVAAASLYKDIISAKAGLEFTPSKNIVQTISSIVSVARHLNPQRDPNEFIFSDYAEEAVNPAKVINRI